MIQGMHVRFGGWGAAFAFSILAAMPAANRNALADETWQPVDLRQVQVGGEIGRRIAVTIDANVLKLNVEKDFLRPLKARERKDGYVAAGKLLDAVARLAAYQKGPALLAMKNEIVETIIASQQENGYVGIMLPEQRMSALWDIHEMGYLVFGLLTDYELFGNERSLQSARRLADYIMANWNNVPADWGQKTGVATSVAVTGIERSMLRLNAATGDTKYLDFCVKQRQLPGWAPSIVIGRRPLIEGHIYAYLSRCLAQLELHSRQTDERLLGPTRQAMEFLTRNDGMALTGGCGQWEIWTDDQDVRGELGETCATAYQLRVFDHLLRSSGESKWGDLMERTIHNALFAAQSPDGAQIRYYAPLEGPREYFPLQNYCCPGNYRRIIAELPQFLYYRTEKGIAVNLYSASGATITLPSSTVGIVQETDYPNSGKVLVRVTLTKPAAFEVRLRTPAWCDHPHVSVNGERIDGTKQAGFIKIERTWKSGDTILLDLPMEWRLVLGRKRQAGRAAVMRGPMVFCLDGSQSEQLAGRDGADLGHITLDPESISDPLPDEAVHPGGLACTIEAWKPGYRVERPGDLKLRLTEFAIRRATPRTSGCRTSRSQETMNCSRYRTHTTGDNSRSFAAGVDEDHKKELLRHVGRGSRWRWTLRVALGAALVGVGSAAVARGQSAEATGRLSAGAIK